MRESSSVLFLLFVLSVVLVPFAATAEEPQEDFKETYEAFAVAMGTSNPPVLPPGATTTFQINVTRWTTDEERASLFAALIEKGQKGLVDALQKQEETGFVRITGRGAQLTRFPSERLRYAREIVQGGKRRLVLALDRPISFWEVANSPRWRDYDVTLIVMDVDEEGKGEGQLAMGVRLEIDQEKRTLLVENFGTEPIRLTNVRRR